MVDTHCHIYHEYYEDIDDLLKKIQSAGVDKIIVNGCDMKSNIEVLELTKKYDMVYGALGFHPTEEHNDIEKCMTFLQEHVNDSKIVAIGEIGLDYHYPNYDKNGQILLFKKQLDIASSNNKPVIVHTRDAIQETYDILSLYHLKGTIHAFSGSVEMARKFISLGYCIGIGGVCTYKNANNIIKVIEETDLAYILLETDSPYLTPVPFRGQKNSPEYIPIIAKKISEIKKIDLDKVTSLTTNNANRLFDF